MRIVGRDLPRRKPQIALHRIPGRSRLPFSAWGDVFGDQAVAAAMIDHIVHHADVVTLKGASYRLRGHETDTVPSARLTAEAERLTTRTRWPHFQP